MIQDRRGIFTPAFREFLGGMRRVAYQERTQRRYRQEDGSWKALSYEWRDVEEPNYKEEVLPQTLTLDDVQHDRWPVPIYRFTLADGRVLESFVQESRDFGSMGLTVDFLGIREVGNDNKVEELCWGSADIVEYLPNITSHKGRGLEVREPQPV